MLPPALVDTYQQYKKDTDSVAAWLASTAKSLGFSSDLQSAPGPAQGSGRLKGKARTAAKKAVAAPEGPSSSRAGSRYRIKVASFIQLAKFVASKAVKVPPSFQKTIDRVIAARVAFSGQLTDHGEAAIERKDGGHRHFVGVLEAVREVPQPFMLPHDDDDLDQVANHSTVYELSTAFMNTRAAERPAAVDNAMYEADVEPTLEEALFALTAVVNDMNHVRARIKWIWSNVKDGVFDVAAAAITTDTAIKLVQHITADITPLLVRHGGLDVVLGRFHLVQAMVRGFAVDDCFTHAGPENSNDNLNYDTYDDGTFLTTERLVGAFVGAVSPGEIPLYNEGVHDVHDPTLDRAKLSGRAKFCQDRALLMPFFTELVTVLGAVPGFPVKDEFLRSMQEALHTKQVTLGLVFAAQVFLDVTYQLGTAVETPFVALRQHMTVMAEDLDAHFSFHADLRTENWPSIYDEGLRGLQMNIRDFERDAPLQVQRRLYKRMNTPSRASPGHRIFRMSPVISGLFLFHYRHRYRDVGRALANAWGSIQSCYHLYQAAMREKLLLPSRWRDMDVCDTIVGTDSFFVGGDVPMTPDEATAKFCLHLGILEAVFEKNRRVQTALASPAGPRGFRPGASVLSMFVPRYVEDSGQIDLTPAHVGRIIDRSLFQEKAGPDGWLQLVQIDDPMRPRKNMTAVTQQQPPRTKAADGGILTPAQLIRPLVLALDAERLEYAFPYMHFHRLCWMALRDVRDACDGVLRERYTAGYIERENQLPLVVGWALAAASSTSDMQPLQRAAEALDAFCDTRGCEIIDVLRERLSIPIAFKAE